MAVDRQKILTAAQKYVSKGQYDRAIQQYQTLLKADATDVRTWLKVGELHHKMGNVDKAVETYERVGNHYQTQGFFLKAVAAYNRILKLKPKRLDVALRLGETYESLEHTADAIATYEKVGAAYAKQGNVKAMLEVLSRMVRVEPKNIPVRIKYAEALSKTNNKELAADEFAAGAQLLLAEGRTADYVKVAERLLFHRPNVAIAKHLARLHVEEGDAKRALGKLQLAFQENPKDTDTLSLLAKSFELLGQQNKALSVYRELARVYQETDEPEKREVVMREILRLDPSDPDAMKAIASRAPEPEVEVGSGEMLLIEEDDSGVLVMVDDEDSGIELLVEPTEDSGQLLVVEDDDDDFLDLEVAEDEAVEVQSLRPAITTASQAPMPAELQAELDEIDGAASNPFAAAPFDALEDVGLDIEVDVAPEPRLEISLETQIESLMIEYEVFSKSGEMEKAVEKLEAVLELDESHVRARVLLKDAYLAMGRGHDARGQLLALAELTPDPSQVAIYRNQASLLSMELPSAPAPAAAPEFVEPDDDDLLFLDDPSDSIEVSFAEPRLDSVEESSSAPQSTGPRSEPTEDFLDEFDVEELTPVTSSITDEGEVRLVHAERFSSTPPSNPDPIEMMGLPSVPPGAPEPPVAAASAPTPTAEVEEILDEVDFYLMQGLWEVARSTVEEGLLSYPNHLVLLDKLEQIADGEREASMRLSPVEQEQLQRRDDVFAMAEKLAEELGPAASSPPEAATDLLDVDQVFEQFKRGVAEQVDDSDSDTHFDLGIAYKEMGLLDDAIHEFTVAMNNRERQCLCLTMVGLCRVEKGDITGAVSDFKKGLYVENKSEAEELSLYYELGNCYGLLSDTGEALYYFNKVLKRDPDYRDVVERVAVLKGGEAKADEGGLQLDDLDAAFDDLLADD